MKNRYPGEQAELERTKQSGRQITKSTQLLTEALTQQTTLRRQATTDARLIDRGVRRRARTPPPGKARPRPSAGPTCSGSRTKSSPPNARRWAQALSEYRQHIDALNAEANRHLAEVKRIGGKAPVVDVHGGAHPRHPRQGMTDFEATEDRKRQIAEYQEQAAGAGQWRVRAWPASSRRRRWTCAQVATSQTNEAKRGEDAQAVRAGGVAGHATEAQSRDAYRRQEYHRPPI